MRSIINYGVSLLMTVSVAVPAHGKKPKVAIPPDAAELFRRPYQEALDGNKNDAELNRKRAVFYSAKSLELTGNSNKAARKRAKDFDAVSKLYQQISDLNTAIVELLTAGEVDKAMVKMDEIPGIEKTLTEISGKPVDRSWLTLGEMRHYKSLGYRFRNKDPMILPLAKSNWKLSAEPPGDDQNRKGASSKRAGGQ